MKLRISGGRLSSDIVDGGSALCAHGRLGKIEYDSMLQISELEGSQAYDMLSPQAPTPQFSWYAWRVSPRQSLVWELELGLGRKGFYS